MTNKERIQAVLNGEGTDRPPVSLWRHFHLSEQQPETLAETLVNYQETYDWDFLKVTFRDTYYGEAWGCEYAYGEDEDTAPAQYTTRIVGAGSFEELEVLDPEDDVLGEHLTCLRKVRRRRRNDVPFLMTVHSPLYIADLIVGDPVRTLSIMREHPESFKKGLETIAATMGSFVVECLRSTGVDGLIFITPPWATHDHVTIEEYNEFGRPFDLLVFELVQNSEFSILQVSGRNCLVADLLDYPVHALNWDSSDAANPTLQDIAARTQKALVGGVCQRGSLLKGTPGDVVTDAQTAIDAVEGKRLLIGPSASCPTNVPEANTKALSDWVHGLSEQSE